MKYRIIEIKEKISGNIVYKNEGAESEFTDFDSNIAKWDVNAHDIVDTMTTLQAVQNASYRKLKYPSVEECIHALLDGGQTLIDLQQKRLDVKLKYPKGE